jgi:hypothetical protein
MKGYRGVLCRKCNEPIPVSSKVGDRHDAFEYNETDTPGGFVARCRVCEHESVYSIRDVKTFDGEPRKRSGKTRRAGA